MLTLKAEQAAIKTISPPEWSLRDCLLLSENPPRSMFTLSVFYISLIFSRLSSSPSAHSLSFPRSLSVGACGAREYPFSLVIYP